jgi:sugar phosphate isomerase/epimerase
MRLAYTIAAPDGGAPPLAMHGDFPRDLDRLREAGFLGAELYVKDASRLSATAIARQVADAGLQVPAICTGEVYGTDGLSFSSDDPSVRTAALERTRRIIEFAAQWHAPVNIGRLRGPLPAGANTAAQAGATARVEDAFHEIADVAADGGVEMILEPINKHEINFINTTAEGITWVRRINHPAFKLMIDLYHVHLEDPSVSGSLVAAGGMLRHVHVCDGNRLAPGWGHMNLKEALATLRSLDYEGWVTVEALQVPTPDAAVEQSGRHLREILITLSSLPVRFHA